MPLCFIPLATAENGSLLTEEITGTGPSLLNGDDIELLPQEHYLRLEHTLPGEGNFMYIFTSVHKHSWLKEIKVFFLTRAESSREVF